MIPNNNLSVLPWYSSIEQQNARRWWVYGRVYPLFTPAGFLMPFQVARPSSSSTIEVPGDEILDDYSEADSALAYLGGDQYEFQEREGCTAGKYDVQGLAKIYVENLPRAIEDIGEEDCNLLFVDQYDYVLTHYDLKKLIGTYNGVVEVPAGAVYAVVQSATDAFPDEWAKISKVATAQAPTPVESFQIFDKDGNLVGDFSNDVISGITIKALADYDVIVYPGSLPFAPSFDNGQYYAVMSDGTNTWYSEVFTVVNDISPYLKIEWWDNEDFVMDAGTIVYKNPTFHNIVYLDAEIAKPAYQFEEEVEDRDGYMFPVKQISEKRYRFSFLASEYLLDVLRFVRMADYVEITKNGKRYSVDSFLITPEWESNGDVAAVQAEFDTATVAKKIGVGYIKAQRGDFNDDFNPDYLINNN